MKIWEDEFGADADGRRGVTQINYELEDSDKEKVAQLIVEEIYGADSVKSSYELEYEDLIIEVDLSFCSDEVINIIASDDLDEDIKQDYLNKIKEICDDK